MLRTVYYLYIDPNISPDSVLAVCSFGGSRLAEEGEMVRRKISPNRQYNTLTFDIDFLYFAETSKKNSSTEIYIERVNVRNKEASSIHLPLPKGKLEEKDIFYLFSLEEPRLQAANLLARVCEMEVDVALARVAIPQN